MWRKYLIGVETDILCGQDTQDFYLGLKFTGRSLFLQSRWVCIQFYMGGTWRRKVVKWNKWPILLFYSPLNIFPAKGHVQITKTQTTRNERNEKSTAWLLLVLKLMQAWSDGGSTHQFLRLGGEAVGSWELPFCLYWTAGFCSTEFTYLCNHQMHHISKKYLLM